MSEPRRAQTVLSTLEVLLKETLASADHYEAQEKTAKTDVDRSHASGMRQWCEGRAVAYQNSINELREEFGEGGEDDNGE